jgi:hypothetical protein
MLSVASALLDENEGLVQFPPEGAAAVVVAGVVGLVVVVVAVLLVGVIGWVGVAVAVLLVGAVGLVIAPEAPAFSGTVVVVVFGATSRVVDGDVVVAVEVVALFCACAFPADVCTGEDPPSDKPIAIPPPTIVSARTAMPARAAALLRGLMVGGLSSVTYGKATSRPVRNPAGPDCE